MPVTVDLPLVPPTATLRCAALSSCARNSGRVRCVRPSSFARTTSGTVGSTAAEVTSVIPSCKPGAVLREQLDAERAQIVELVRRPPGVERAVGARDLGARWRGRCEASGSMPLPPMPLKKTGESIIAAALLNVAGNGQHHARMALASSNVPNVRSDAQLPRRRFEASNSLR